MLIVGLNGTGAPSHAHCFLCFGTGRARNFPLILVDVLPRELIEILATLA